jgi:putative membrane protein
MSDTPRRPSAFPIAPEAVKAAGNDKEQGRSAPEAAVPRNPRAAPVEMAVAVPVEQDIFDVPDIAEAVPPPASAPRNKRSLASRILLGAAGILVSLGVGLWIDNLVRSLFERTPWLGWLAAGVAAIGAIALLVVLAREIRAIARLAGVEKMQKRALDALARNDPKAARAVVDELSAFVASRPETAAGRRALEELRGDVIDGADLVRLAETEILAPLDARARIMVLDAAKRVSLVTAVSPRAIVDIAYVAFESARLIRRLSELYGGRPGTLGFFRLARGVLAHLAITGSIALGDGFVQQILGHGLAARLSAKLGEGVVNGMLTARIGLAAMDTTRPLPFQALKRPGMSDFLSALTSFASKETRTKTQEEAQG